MSISLINDWVELTRSNWREALKEKYYGYRFALNFLICLTTYLLITHFIFINRHRPGVILNDPFHNLFTPVDFSVPLFLLTQSAIFAILYDLIPRPKTLYYAFRAFLAIFFLRVLFIYFLPLQPPADMILLKDPFIDIVIGFRGRVTNDLFFSGHLSDLSFFVLCCRGKVIQKYLVVVLILVSVMLIVQKVHYTADVLASPFFAYVCYDLIVKKHNTTTI